MVLIPATIKKKVGSSLFNLVPCSAAVFCLIRREIILQEASPMSGVFQNIDPSPPGECTVYPPLVRGEDTLVE